ncbi:MAG: putative transposase [Chlamydiales bacterium]|jgi:putative transposase
MDVMAHIYPLHILIASLAGLINRRQAEVLEYLIEENRVLKEQMKGRRLRLTDDQRRRLAAKGKRIGRRLLMQVATIVTPDTILRWHNRLIRAKWTFPAKRVGRPGLMKEIRALIIRFAQENCGWGYTRIEGALRNVGHRVAPTTIRNVLKANGIKPAPDRPTTWRAFLKTHWDQIAATDFFTIEVWTVTGLKTDYVLFLIELDTRRVHLAGITRHPNGMWMGYVAERAAAFLKGRRFLICDGDMNFRYRFKIVMEAAGIKLVKTPYRAPNANAYAERFVRSIREECLSRMILFGEAHLRRVVDEYLLHFNHERNHQGIGNELEVCPWLRRSAVESACCLVQAVVQARDGLRLGLCTVRHRQRADRRRRCHRYWVGRVPRASWRPAQVLPPRGLTEDGAADV